MARSKRKEGECWGVGVKGGSRGGGGVSPRPTCILIYGFSHTHIRVHRSIFQLRGQLKPVSTCLLVRVEKYFSRLRGSPGQPKLINSAGGSIPFVGPCGYGSPI